MTIRLEHLDFLTSDAGARLLERLSQEDLRVENSLRLLTALRKDHAPEYAGAALELAQLRHAGAAKFGTDAARMYFTRDALEQASDPLIRDWRAKAWRADTVTDVCCGVGSDTLTFARAGAAVIGLDHDPLRVALARLNAQALRVDARFEVADVRQGVPEAELIFFDPARRTADGKRVFHVEAYEPPLSSILDWNAPARCVKLSPGVDKRQLGGGLASGSLDFISVAGDLKEANLVWTDKPRARLRAVLLDGKGAHVWEQDGRENEQAAPDDPHGWLCEPDPALIRAELVQAAAARYGGRLLDKTIAYFTAGRKPETPWIRAWEIEAWMPFSTKRLGAYLRVRGVGRVTVKKRGTAVTPEALISQLKLKGSAERVIVLTRLHGAQIAIVCQPYCVD